MATYTDNYSLTKPTFAEVADIRTINGNMDTIDDIMHASQVSLADAYDQTATYNTGDVVMYEFLMYKCKEDNVTGNWDATKWERTTAAETGGGEVDFDLFGEASGNPASFADGAAAGLVECIADIEAAQDLHGYDKPWAGGAGKNLFPMTVNEIKTNNVSVSWNGNVGIIYGVTITLHTDDGISVSKISISGTPTNTAYLYVGAFNLKSGVSYVLNGCPSNKPDNDVLYVSNQPSGFGSWIDSGNGATYNATQDWNGISFFIRIWANVAQNNDWYPMIRLATETDATFEPYSNICPISGHSSVTINVSPTSDPSQGVDTTIQLGDTYYGGTLNVGKGEFTVTHRVITENDFVSVSSGTSGGGLHYANCNLSEPEATSANAISNMLVQNQSGWGSTTPCFATNTGSAPNIYPVRIYCSESTLADFKAAYSGLQICYELATPITVQLTPTEIATLLGQNYISSEDTEDIDLVYVKATAPIKPNPSGEADGYLSSIELGGVKFEIIKELPTFPTSDGDYKLKLSVSSGVPTLSWVSDT